MEVLFIVLNHEQHFDEVLRAFSAEGSQKGKRMCKKSRRKSRKGKCWNNVFNRC